jgi:hypothetical protein
MARRGSPKCANPDPCAPSRIFPVFFSAFIASLRFNGCPRWPAAALDCVHLWFPQVLRAKAAFGYCAGLPFGIWLLRDQRHAERARMPLTGYQTQEKQKILLTVTFPTVNVTSVTNTTRMSQILLVIPLQSSL